MKNMEKCASQNDALRKWLLTYLLDPARAVTVCPGRVVMSRGVSALSEFTRFKLFVETALFHKFTTDNDPHGEHDCAKLVINETEFLFKIDYYADRSCEYGHEDPNSEDAYRVLTLMLASEY